MQATTVVLSLALVLAVPSARAFYADGGAVHVLTDANFARQDSAEHLSRIGRSAFHSDGPDFHSRALLCHSMTGRTHCDGEMVH